MFCFECLLWQPCVAKNTLCIGASQTVTSGLEMVVHAAFGAAKIHIEPALFGMSAEVMPEISYQYLVESDPPHGCSVPPPAPGRVLLMRRGECLFSVKARNAQAAAAAAVIVYNYDGSSGTVSMNSSTTSGINIAMFMVSAADGLILKQYLASNSNLGVSLPKRHRLLRPFVASYSSKGPASDQRVKPDLVAPGHSIISARSDGNSQSNQCGSLLGQADFGITTKQGTSQATTVIAFYYCR